MCIRLSPWPWSLLALSALGGCDDGGGVTPRVPPPAVAKASPAHPPEVEAAARRGKDLFFGKAVCSTCHRVGDAGTMMVGPNLGVGDGMEAPVGVRAASRRPGSSAAAYVVESILDPDAVVVDGYARGVMKAPGDLPIELTDEELVALATYLVVAGADAPLDAGMLVHAREAIAPARAARERRRAGPGSTP